MKMSHNELSGRFPKLTALVGFDQLDSIQLSFDVVPDAHIVNGCNVAFKAIESHLNNELSVKNLSRIELNEITFVLMQFSSVSKPDNQYHFIVTTMMISLGQLLKAELNTSHIDSSMQKNKDQAIKVDGLINKQGAELLGFYLNMDSTDFSTYEYHRGHFTQKVYCINDVYYCPHKTRPNYRYDDAVFDRKNWVKVTDILFPYSGNIIWRYEHK